MRSGLLRDYVQIQRNSPTQGDSGELIDNWTHLAYTWCRIRDATGEEAITTHQIRMRYRDIMHTDRIVFGSRIFDIVTVLDTEGMKRNLVLEAREDLSEDG